MPNLPISASGGRLQAYEVDLELLESVHELFRATLLSALDEEVVAQDEKEGLPAHPVPHAVDRVPQAALLGLGPERDPLPLFAYGDQTLAGLARELGVVLFRQVLPEEIFEEAPSCSWITMQTSSMPASKTSSTFARIRGSMRPRRSTTGRNSLRTAEVMGKSLVP